MTFKKNYCISTALHVINPAIIATVWFDDNGIAEIKYDAASPSNIRPTEEKIDLAGIHVKAMSDQKIIDDGK